MTVLSICVYTACDCAQHLCSHSMDSYVHGSVSTAARLAVRCELLHGLPSRVAWLGSTSDRPLGIAACTRSRFIWCTWCTCCMCCTCVTRGSCQAHAACTAHATGTWKLSSTQTASETTGRHSLLEVGVQPGPLLWRDGRQVLVQLRDGGPEGCTHRVKGEG